MGRTRRKPTPEESATKKFIKEQYNTPEAVFQAHREFKNQGFTKSQVQQFFKELYEEGLDREHLGEFGYNYFYNSQSGIVTTLADNRKIVQEKRNSIAKQEKVLAMSDQELMDNEGIAAVIQKQMNASGCSQGKAIAELRAAMERTMKTNKNIVQTLVSHLVRADIPEEQDRYYWTPSNDSGGRNPALRSLRNLTGDEEEISVGDVLASIGL
jgi:hypothetical protein